MAKPKKKSAPTKKTTTKKAPAKATTKKTTAKATTKKAPAKKTTKKAATKKAPARRAPKPVQPGLTTLGRQRLLKPSSDYDTVGAEAIEAWKANGRYVKVPDLTAASLGRDLRLANRAWEKERVFRAKMDAKLQPLVDARMRAEDTAQRGLLDLHAEVKSSGRRRPELIDAFAGLAAFANRGGGTRSTEEGDPTPPTA